MPAGYTVDRLGNHHSTRNGRFTPKASRSVMPPSPGRKPTPHQRGRAAGDRQSVERVAAATGLRERPTRQLNKALREITANPKAPGRELALAALDAELARRLGVKKLKARDDRRARRVDELVGRGWSYTDAYAEAHGLDPAKLAAQQRAALVDAQRRPGERREQTVRRMYAERVYLQYLDAEAVTRGHLLSAAGRARGVDPASLWSGTDARARKYASEELKRWWETHGGRMTAAQFRAQYVGGAAARRATQGQRQAGAGRDFGV